jgi:hypothetical protein
MHILVQADPDDMERIWQYCQAKDITMYYGRVDHEYHDIAWQILHDSCSHLDILLLMFPQQLRVLSPF